MLKLIEDAKAMPDPALPEFEPLEHVHAGRGIASNHDLLVTYQKTLEGYFRMWHHHFEFCCWATAPLPHLFRLLQESISRDYGPDHRTNGGWDRCRRYSGPTMNCAASHAAPSSSRSMHTSRKTPPSTISCDRCAPQASPAAAGSRNCRRRANRGSTSTSAMGSITITAAGMTICPCAFVRRACGLHAQRPRRGFAGSPGRTAAR